jgi:hypothetical protein
MPERGGRVHVEIEALAIEAAGPYRADLLARAVEEELARLLSGSGDGAGVLHDREVGVGEAGTAIARAVHAALARGLPG